MHIHTYVVCVYKHICTQCRTNIHTYDMLYVNIIIQMCHSCCHLKSMVINVNCFVYGICFLHTYVHMQIYVVSMCNHPNLHHILHMLCSVSVTYYVLLLYNKHEVWYHCYYMGLRTKSNIDCEAVLYVYICIVFLPCMYQCMGIVYV